MGRIIAMNLTVIINNIVCSEEYANVLTHDKYLPYEVQTNWSKMLIKHSPTP